MGEIDFVGRDALALVQKVATNDAGKLAVNQAMIFGHVRARAHIIDDLVCFKLGENHFFWVVNVTGKRKSSASSHPQVRVRTGGVGQRRFQRHGSHGAAGAHLA